MEHKRVSKYGEILMGLFLMGWIMWGIFCCIGNYNDNIYPFTKAESQFERSHGTNNLSNFAENTQEGLDYLSKYHGNIAYIYPTIETDMNSIKMDIQLIINNSLLAANITTFGSDSYQEALDNAKEALSLQQSRLVSVEWLYFGLGRQYIALIWGWIFTLLFTCILIGIFNYYRWN